MNQVKYMSLVSCNEPLLNHFINACANMKVQSAERVLSMASRSSASREETLVAPIHKSRNSSIRTSITNRRIRHLCRVSRRRNSTRGSWSRYRIGIFLYPWIFHVSISHISFAYPVLCTIFLFFVSFFLFPFMCLYFVSCIKRIALDTTGSVLDTIGSSWGKISVSCTISTIEVKKREDGQKILL